MKRATHQGSCQCCGAMQMLPEGVLAKHGYHVRWGFFDGVCRGSGEPPYEKSCALIEKFITLAKDRRTGLEQFRSELLARPTEPNGWLHLYLHVGGGRKMYVWRKVSFVFTTVKSADGQREFQVAQYLDPQTGNPARLTVYRTPSNDILDYIASANAVYAQDVEKEIGRIGDYISWQQLRVDRWKEAPLTPAVRQQRCAKCQRSITPGTETVTENERVRHAACPVPRRRRWLGW